MEIVASNALGMGAASFWSEAEKDIAESPTASPERPNKLLAISFQQSAIENWKLKISCEPRVMSGEIPNSLIP